MVGFYLMFLSTHHFINKIIMKKKNTEFYLLRQKHISEGDLFVTDYIQTKQRVLRIENDLEILKLRLINDLKLIDD